MRESMIGDGSDIEAAMISALPDAVLKIIGLDLCFLVDRDIEHDAIRSARQWDCRAMLAVTMCRASTP